MIVRGHFTKMRWHFTIVGSHFTKMRWHFMIVGSHFTNSEIDEKYETDENLLFKILYVCSEIAWLEPRISKT